MAALNKFLQKVSEFKIWHHFVIAKLAATPTFCKENFSWMQQFGVMIFFLFALQQGTNVLSEKVTLTKCYLKTKFVLVIGTIKGIFWEQKMYGLLLIFFRANSYDLEYFECRYQKLTYGVQFPLSFHHWIRIYYQNWKS